MKFLFLIPFAVDPHGHFGPMLQRFLFHREPRAHINFPASRPNAKLMYTRASSFPCPLGVVPTATAHWKRRGTRRFFGGSYTAPTPKEYILQKLGLAITKAFAMHLRNTSRKFGARPQSHRTADGSPPGLPHNSETSPFSGVSLR